MAIMGMVAASGRGKARIVFVAVRPSITGIITSIKMPSKVPGRLFSNSSTASWPSFARVSFAPLSFKRDLGNFRIERIVLHQQQRHSRNTQGKAAASSASWAGFGAISKGMVISKVEPILSSLATAMVPPILFRSSLTMVIPRPIPW